MAEAIARSLILLNGPNHTQIDIDPISKLLVMEVLSSFNLYQLFAVFIWIFFRNYLIYGLVVLFTATISIIVEIYVIRSEQNAVNAGQHYKDVTVIRRIGLSKESAGLRSHIVDSRELVPGDLIQIDSNSQVPCDLVILEGVCHVDEAILTGESVPVYKSAIHATNQAFSEENKENMLFLGTKCIRSTSESGPALGMVTKTGFNSAKGGLIRSLVFRDQQTYQYEHDSIYFLLGLAILSSIFFIYYMQMILEFNLDNGIM